MAKFSGQATKTKAGKPAVAKKAGRGKKPSAAQLASIESSSRPRPAYDRSNLGGLL